MDWVVKVFWLILKVLEEIEKDKKWILLEDNRDWINLLILEV